MKRLAGVVMLTVCALGISAVRSSVAANRESQSSRDLLPEGGVIIVSASDGYSWKVWPKGKIEFSYDSSHTWEQQKSGVTADLLAGASPSGKVCWIVGKDGTVLLTTDKGKHWKQVVSPTKDALVGAYAQDAKRASVWTVSHKQSFETNDGGVTWTANVEK